MSSPNGKKKKPYGAAIGRKYRNKKIDEYRKSNRNRPVVTRQMTPEELERMSVGQMEKETHIGDIK